MIARLAPTLGLVLVASATVSPPPGNRAPKPEKHGSTRKFGQRGRSGGGDNVSVDSKCQSITAERDSQQQTIAYLRDQLAAQAVVIEKLQRDKKQWQWPSGLTWQNAVHVTEEAAHWVYETSWGAFHGFCGICSAFFLGCVCTLVMAWWELLLANRSVVGLSLSPWLLYAGYLGVQCWSNSRRMKELRRKQRQLRMGSLEGLIHRRCRFSMNAGELATISTQWEMALSDLSVVCCAWTIFTCSFAWVLQRVHDATAVSNTLWGWVTYLFVGADAVVAIAAVFLTVFSGGAIMYLLYASRQSVAALWGRGRFEGAAASLRAKENLETDLLQLVKEYKDSGVQDELFIWKEIVGTVLVRTKFPKGIKGCESAYDLLASFEPAMVWYFKNSLGAAALAAQPLPVLAIANSGAAAAAADAGEEAASADDGAAAAPVDDGTAAAVAFDGDDAAIADDGAQGADGDGKDGAAGEVGDGGAPADAGEQ